MTVSFSQLFDSHLFLAAANNPAVLAAAAALAQNPSLVQAALSLTQGAPGMSASPSTPLHHPSHPNSSFSR